MLNMQSRKIQIGVIGAGKIASFFHLPVLSNFQDVEIAFIADIRDAGVLARVYRAQAITIRESLEALPVCDVVLLAIPVGVRDVYIQEFARRGSYIFSEKPFAPTLEQHKLWMSLTDRMMCNYHRVLYKPMRQMKRLLGTDVLGELRAVRIWEGGLIGKTGKGKGSYQNDLKLSGGGIVIEWGCHTLSQLDYLFDDYQSTLIRADVEYQDGFDVELNAAWEFVREGRIVSVEYQLSVVRPLRTGIEFEFERATVTFDHTKPDALLAISGRKTKSTSGSCSFLLHPDHKGAQSNYQAFYLKWKNFLESARTGEKLNVERETSLRTTQWIDGIYARARKPQMKVGR